MAGASALVALLISRRSPPAKKVFFAEVITTPVMLSFSASSRVTVSSNERRNVSFMVFADWSGSSMVSTTMPSPSASQRNMFSVMCVSLRLAR